VLKYADYNEEETEKERANDKIVNAAKKMEEKIENFRCPRIHQRIPWFLLLFPKDRASLHVMSTKMKQRNTRTGKLLR
jgi:hypothetical protein